MRSGGGSSIIIRWSRVVVDHCWRAAHGVPWCIAVVAVWMRCCKGSRQGIRRCRRLYLTCTQINEAHAVVVVVVVVVLLRSMALFRRWRGRRRPELLCVWRPVGSRVVTTVHGVKCNNNSSNNNNNGRVVKEGEGRKNELVLAVLLSYLNTPHTIDRRPSQCAPFGEPEFWSHKHMH